MAEEKRPDIEISYDNVILAREMYDVLKEIDRKILSLMQEKQRLDQFRVNMNWTYTKVLDAVVTPPLGADVLATAQNFLERANKEILWTCSAS